MTITPPQGLFGLNEDDKARIRAEEIFRGEVHLELEAQRPPKPWHERVWSLLNSSFMLWVLSSVVLSVVSFEYARHQARVEQRKLHADLERSLTTEIGNRISMAQNGLRIDTMRIKQVTQFILPAQYMIRSSNI
jgi:hypothetical protein